MKDQFLYTTEVEWTGSRHGELRAPNLKVRTFDV